MSVEQRGDHAGVAEGGDEGERQRHAAEVGQHARGGEHQPRAAAGPASRARHRDGERSPSTAPSTAVTADSSGCRGRRGGRRPRGGGRWSPVDQVTWVSGSVAPERPTASTPTAAAGRPRRSRKNGSAPSAASRRPAPAAAVRAGRRVHRRAGVPCSAGHRLVPALGEDLPWPRRPAPAVGNSAVPVDLRAAPRRRPRRRCRPPSWRAAGPGGRSPLSQRFWPSAL